MKLYVVEIKSTAVVLAENKNHANIVASSHRSEIVGDDLDVAIEVKHEVKALTDLPDGFSEDDIPCGDYESATIAELLVP